MPEPEVVPLARPLTVTRRLGEFTSLEHCLQQRAVRLPEEVRAELVELAAAGDEGVEALGEMPVAEEPG